MGGHYALRTWIGKRTRRGHDVRDTQPEFLVDQDDPAARARQRLGPGHWSGGRPIGPCPVRSRLRRATRATMQGMEQRISLITLGVADLRRAMHFYSGLGWNGYTPDDDVAFYQAGDMV